MVIDACIAPNGISCGLGAFSGPVLEMVIVACVAALIGAL